MNIEYWELYCILTALDDLTCKLGLAEAEKLSVDLCRAIGAFRGPLIAELNRVGRVVEQEIAHNLVESINNPIPIHKLKKYPKSIQETVSDVLSGRTV